MIDRADTASVPSANYSIKPLTLRFADERIEQRFTDEHLARALPPIRIFGLAACLFYAAFGILDIYIVPEVKTTVWVIRYVGVCPVMIGLVLLSYSPIFRRMTQLALAVGMFSGGIGIVAMTALADPPGNSLYYAGLIMVIIYGSSLVRLRCIYAALISIALVGSYQAVAILVNPIPSDVLLNNDFFLGVALVFGVFSSYVQELHSRRDFISTELIRHEKALSDELRREAEAANRAKSDFLAVMSHELRTPLNAILGFSEIMQQRMFGPVGSQRYVTYVDDIHNTAVHLLNIITDILDLSKAEVGKLTLHEEDVDVRSILDQCLRLVRERALEQGLRLSLQAPDGTTAVVRADARLVKQVFLNLLGNAIKFTLPGGSVSAAIETDAGGGCMMRFADTGIGIAEADLPRVLEPFVQVESAFARKHGGTGLGLPLVRKIMELHGGSITIISTLGAGTTVTVRFPAERVVGSVRLAAGVA